MKTEDQEKLVEAISSAAVKFGISDGDVPLNGQALLNMFENIVDRYKLMQEELELPSTPPINHNDAVIQDFVRQIEKIDSHDQVIELCATLVSRLGPPGGRTWTHNQAVVNQAMEYAGRALRALKTPVKQRRPRSRCRP